MRHDPVMRLPVIVFLFVVSVCAFGIQEKTRGAQNVQIVAQVAPNWVEAIFTKWRKERFTRGEYLGLVNGYRPPSRYETAVVAMHLANLLYEYTATLLKTGAKVDEKSKGFAEMMQIHRRSKDIKRLLHFSTPEFQVMGGEVGTYLSALENGERRIKRYMANRKTQST